MLYFGFYFVFQNKFLLNKMSKFDPQMLSFWKLKEEIQLDIWNVQMFSCLELLNQYFLSRKTKRNKIKIPVNLRWKITCLFVLYFFSCDQKSKKQKRSNERSKRKSFFFLFLLIFHQIIRICLRLCITLFVVVFFIFYFFCILLTVKSSECPTNRRVIKERKKETML